MGEHADGTSDAAPDWRPPSITKVLVAVCTLNESENIAPLIDAIRKAIPDADVLVVDDDSADGTGQIVSALAVDDRAVRLCVRRGERGLGGAIAFAMQQAIDGDYDVFINLDGDFSHDPAQLVAMLASVQESPDVDVVIGSRYVDGGRIVGWPRRRRMMSAALNRFATAYLRLPVNDCSGSMRCYRVDSLREIDLDRYRSSGYAMLEDVLLALHQNGAKFVEVPITFTDRQRGKSKLTTREAIRSAIHVMKLARQQPQK